MTTLLSELCERGRRGLQRPAAPGKTASFEFLDRVRTCERTLRSYCEECLAGSKEGLRLPPKAAWLMDHYSYVRSQVQEIREALPRVYFRALPRIKEGPHRGKPRVYRLAVEFLEPGRNELRIEEIAAFFRACQESEPLLLGELWAIGAMLKLAVIESLCMALESDASESAVRQAILHLKALEIIAWKDLVESVSRVEDILRRDPAGVYASMDFSTRDAYRHVVENIARRSRCTEEEVAAEAARLAGESPPGSRENHVGFYLLGSGVQELKARTGYKAPLMSSPHDWACRYPAALYLLATAGVTALLMAGFSRLFPEAAWWLLALLLIPVSQLATAIINLAVPQMVPPLNLPRLDFSDGIPFDCRTFVVVPTLLLSRPVVDKLLERLEIHYLANRDPNLFFALLTDFPDSQQPEGEQDGLLDLCAEGVRLLNERYGSGGTTPFYLFHRNRTWNESESAWMGWERKRGKVVDFNKLLLGEGNAFSTAIGDLSVLPSIRYVITLDTDTRLPRDTAGKMIATLAHPLNRPVVDPVTNTVRVGYAILQPRISISMESAAKSRLARIYSGQTGFDPYTTAVSDVYQDLHARASYTGKGIYDLSAFHTVAGQRFPDNTLLSHDLIEGEYLRTGLITDIELIDDYPASYEAYCKRKHRWVRGDWQTLPWLFPKTPSQDGPEPNPLPAISRWKVADNLRRSLLEIFLLLAVVAGWLWRPAQSALWTVAILGTLAAPAYLSLALSLVHLPPRRFLRAYFAHAAHMFAQAHIDAFLSASFLLHQACLMADAVIRTLVRRFVTRRKLLEWESMAQTEEAGRSGPGLAGRYLIAAQLLSAALLFYLAAHTDAAGVPIGVAAVWAASPLLASWLSEPPKRREKLSLADVRFLRGMALRTWRYFADFSGLEHNGLVPDNVQQDPPAVANRISPTNLGLALTASLAAYDFGYTGRGEFAARLTAAFRSISRMERYRGHFYNWYDTATLDALPPRYISTVDSGNLAASLLALKQGCLEMLERPVIELSVLEGLYDHCVCLREALPSAARTSSVTRLIASLLRHLESRPTGLFFWEGVLGEVNGMVRTLGGHLEWARSRVGRPAMAEADYWYRALSARSRAALEDLYALAPWLAPPLEFELRARSGDASLAPLFAELERVPAFSGLSQQYRRIAAEIRERLSGREMLHPATAAVLQRLAASLRAASARAECINLEISDHARHAGALAEEMDFRFLFDAKRKLMRIGFDAATGTLDEGAYDLLASEARTAVFLAIAKGDIPRESWFRLGRKLVSYGGARTLVSWGGTMFEYLMPYLYMRNHEGTLLGESAKAAVKIHQRYAKQHGVPWGISEAAFNARDNTLNYQYRTFGVPEIALRRESPEDLVIAPYASMLALMIEPAAAVENLRTIAAGGTAGRYGFFEAIDHTRARNPHHKGGTIVRAFMTHHQAMGLLSICNTLLGQPMQRRLHADPLVEATQFLLEERVPVLVASREEQQPSPGQPESFYARLARSAGRAPRPDRLPQLGPQADRASG